jgi:adenylate cyclase
MRRLPDRLRTAVRLFRLGSVTNLASRLCDEAKSGQIIVEARVFNAVEGLAAEGLFEARALQPMSFKGFRWPVEAYEIVGRRQALPKGP